jgi:predicted transcriptional regulator
MNEFLPMVRCGSELKEALERIAARSVSPRLSDHIRFAVEQYVERELTMLKESEKELAHAANN